MQGEWDEYLLTPADLIAGLSSPSVALNGRELSMVDPHGDAPALPPLPPAPKAGQEITIPGLAFGFYVLVSSHASRRRASEIWVDFERFLGDHSMRRTPRPASSLLVGGGGRQHALYLYSTQLFNCYILQFTQTLP